MKRPSELYVMAASGKAFHNTLKVNHLSHTFQNIAKRPAKHGILQRKRPPFAMRKVAF